MPVKAIHIEHYHPPIPRIRDVYFAVLLVYEHVVGLIQFYVHVSAGDAENRDKPRSLRYGYSGYKSQKRDGCHKA